MWFDAESLEKAINAHKLQSGVQHLYKCVFLYELLCKLV